MANPILVTGAAGRVGAVGRTVTELLLKQGKEVRAMVRTEDERAQALRALGAEVVVGNLLDLDSMHRAIDGVETMYFGLSVSDTYLAATVNTAAVAKHHGVKAFINMSQMTVSQMSITETTPSPQHKLHWLAEEALNEDVECKHPPATRQNRQLRDHRAHSERCEDDRRIREDPRHRAQRTHAHHDVARQHDVRRVAQTVEGNEDRPPVD